MLYHAVLCHERGEVCLKNCRCVPDAKYFLIPYFLDRKRHTPQFMASIMPTMNKMILALRIVTAAFGIVSAFDVQHIFSSQSRESQYDSYALYANSFGVPFRNESYDYVYAANFCSSATLTVIADGWRTASWVAGLLASPSLPDSQKIPGSRLL